MGHEMHSKTLMSQAAVVYGMGPCIHEVPYQFFQDNILPILPRRVNVLDTIGRLKAAHIITKLGRWVQFPSDPHEYAKQDDDEDKLNENMVFAKLVPLIKAIVDHSGHKQNATVEYESLPDMSPVCYFEDTLAQLDGYLLFKNRTIPERRDGRRYWHDIATPAEFSLQDTQTDIQHDVLKICWNMHQVMLEDPRRRFVCAFTIENTRMRVWMGSRSGVLVSEPFNFIEDHEKFVHFILAQSIGKEHELGIDPTVTQVKTSEAERPQYDYVVRTVTKSQSRKNQVKNLVYRTDGLINGDGAKSLKGRGTRIWRVHEVVKGQVDLTSSGVLKDFWVDDDRKAEGEIHEEIKGRPGLSDKVVRALHTLLLTPIAIGDVFIEGFRDGTRTLITRGASISINAVPFPLEVPSSYKPSHMVPNAQAYDHTIPEEAPQRKNKVASYRGKFRHRVVFKEECVPLSSVTSLKRVFRCLLHIVSGIPLLHMPKPGWVHGDISLSNILIVPAADGKPERTKLSDLEFARRLDISITKEIRTGTPNFMAVEVDKELYLFQSGQSSNSDDTDLDELCSAEEALEFYADLAAQYRNHGYLTSINRPVTQDAVQLEATPHVPFRYNPSHDLESILWIAIYFVVNVETSIDKTWHPLADEQLRYARSLFYGAEARILAITLLKRSPLDAHMRSLAPHLAAICEDLIKLRIALYKHYREIESPGYTIDNMVCSKLYKTFIRGFQNILCKLQKDDIFVAPLEQDPRVSLKQDGNSKTA